MPAALEPLPISISTLLEPTNAPTPDPDIEITSEEDNFEPALKQPNMDVAVARTTVKPTEIKAGLSEDFSGRNDDATCWLMAMKAYFGINKEIFSNEKLIVLVMLNKMSKGRGATFTKGWYLKLTNKDIPKSKKTFDKLCTAFKEIIIPKDLKDHAHQMVYSLSMDQFNQDFDHYSTTFQFAQVCRRIDNNSILVDALQQGVTNCYMVCIIKSFLAAPTQV